MSDRPTYRYVTYIEATPERVWDALTDEDLSAAYWGHRNVSDWEAGSRWEHQRVDGSGIADVVGTVLTSDPPRRLVITFDAPADPHPDHVDLVDRHFGPDAVEGASLVAHGGWHYLFVPFDSCCQGASSTYHVVVGRSRSVTGPYVDRHGTSMLAGGGSAVLDGEGDMRGPGGESVAGDTFAFHYYDAARNGDFHLGLADLTYRDGWPVLTHLRI